MKTSNRIGGAFVAVALIMAHSAVAAQPKAPVANAGTLTCVIAAGDASGTSRTLSCTFVRAAGPNAQFSGIVKSLGAELEGSKIVLVWSVLAPTADVDAADLSGRYVGSVGPRAEGKGGPEGGIKPNTGGLVGGASQSIRLVPLSTGPTAGTNIANSILDLELTTMKA